MNVLAIALDFDGTIAQNDDLDPLVLDAIAKVRGQGIAVIFSDGPHPRGRVAENCTSRTRWLPRTEP